MVASLEEFIYVSSKLSSQAGLLELFLNTVEAEGYQNAVFAKARDRRLTSIPWNHFPTGYLDEYRAFEWDKIDPIVQHIHSARRPFRWADLCAHAGLTGKQKIFLHQCRELGVHSGVTIPLHGPGTEVDLISLSLRDEKSETVDRLGVLYAISAQYWLKYNELNDPPAPKEMHLTAKELNAPLVQGRKDQLGNRRSCRHPKNRRVPSPMRSKLGAIGLPRSSSNKMRAHLIVSRTSKLETRFRPPGEPQRFERMPRIKSKA